jgi:hypothetical protein
LQITNVKNQYFLFMCTKCGFVKHVQNILRRTLIQDLIKLLKNMLMSHLTHSDISNLFNVKMFRILSSLQSWHFQYFALLRLLFVEYFPYLGLISTFLSWVEQLWISPSTKLFSRFIRCRWFYIWCKPVVRSQGSTLKLVPSLWV